MALLLSLVLLIPVSSGQDVASMENVVSKPSWGVSFTKVGTLLNGVTNYRHTWAIALPDMTFEPIELLPCATDIQREFFCAEINALASRTNAAFGEEFDSMRTLLEYAYEAIPTRTRDSSRRHRRSAAAPHLSADFCDKDQLDGGDSGGGLLSGIGKIASALLGTPTFDDIKTVDKHICELADTVDLNRQEIVASNERLTSISAAINGEISVLQGGLKATNERITDTQRALTALSGEFTLELNNLTERLNALQKAQAHMYLVSGLLTTFRHEAYSHIRYAASFLAGVDRLLEGYLPQELVTLKDVRRVIAHIQTTVLPAHNLRMVNYNPSFYYQMKNLVYTRSSNYLFVSAKFPLRTVGGALAVYRIDQTHLSLSQDDPASTRITNLPDLIAFTPDRRYYTELTMTQYVSCDGGKDIKTCRTQRSLRSSGSKSCAAALFFDHKRAVLDECSIAYEAKDVPTSVWRLDSGKYLVHASNVTDSKTFTFHCPAARRTRQRPACTACEIHVPCGCSVDGGDFFIPERLSDCSPLEEDEPKVLYPVNLPLVASTYRLSDIQRIDGETVALRKEELLELASTKFNIRKSNWPSVVKADAEYEIDFRHLLAQHDNASEIYSDRAEYYLKKATDFTDLQLTRLSDLEKAFGGSFLKNFLNPTSTTTATVLFWLLSILCLAMSIFNCCRKR